MNESGDSIKQLQRDLNKYRNLNDAANREIRELHRLLEAAHHREKSLRVRGSLSLPENSDDVVLTPEDRDDVSSSDERVRPNIIDELQEIEDGDGCWIETGETPNALSPHPGWGNLSSVGKNGIVIGVSLLGIEASRQLEVIDLVARQQLRVRQLFPLFLVDTDDFSPLRMEHFVFEYLPPWPADRIGISKEDWERFLADRLLLIRRKWGVRRFISFHDREDPQIKAVDDSDFGGLGKALFGKS